MESAAAISAAAYVKPHRISLKGHPELREKWVQDRLTEDPSILGLGNLTLRKVQDSLPGGGRLDILFESDDEEEPQSYEVEIQLGRTDPSHIIRTIEYWDLEQRRYPERKHIAVLVAEDITSRFLNVISLLNRSVPIVAIQMQAIQVGTQVTLVFATVVDLSLRQRDESREAPTANREYWEKKNKSVLPIVDKFLAFVKQQEPGAGFAVGYNLEYIQINQGGHNFLTFRPKKTRTRIGIQMSRVAESEELEGHIESAGIEVEYTEIAKGGPHYRLFADNDRLAEHAALIENLVSLGLKESRDEL